MIIRRGSTVLRLAANSHFLSRVRSLCSRASAVNNTKQAAQGSSVNKREITSTNFYSRLHLSPLFSDGKAHLESCKIELVDDETWRVSLGLAEVWRGNAGFLETKAASIADAADDVATYVPSNKNDPDFDEIEDMRIRGNLFYKIDRDSKEYEEYRFDFHRKKSWKNKGDQPESKKENPSHDLSSGVEKSSMNRNQQKESKTRVKPNHNCAFGAERLSRAGKNDRLTSVFTEIVDSSGGKKQRMPTFNQLTAPYHEPFCLDVYISKASVRACIIHRATSKVVAVAHSISKDMKFDLGSTKNKTACAVVGKVLAQRALADDIHNVVYTPRKGEKLEGKLQIVLRSIIDNGVDVKVKLKQRKFKKTGLHQQLAI